MSTDVFVMLWIGAVFVWAAVAAVKDGVIEWAACYALGVFITAISIAKALLS